MSQSTEALFERYGSGYRWLIVLMAMTSTITAVLSATIVNVAVPEIMGSFGMDQVQAQWLASGYLAAMTATMLLLDYGIKTFGQRATMMFALSAFLFGAFLGGFATNDVMMITARFVQGAAAGIMQPMSMVAVYQVFPPERRGFAMGIYGVGAVMAPAVGPYCGGLLVDALDWRYVFFAGVPWVLMGMLLTLLFMPSESNDSGPGKKFDWPGYALVLTFIGCMLTAFADGPRDGWEDTFVVIRLTLAVALFAIFIWWQTYTPHALMNMKLYTYPSFVGATIVSVMLGLGLFGSTYLIPLFVQQVQGLTPTMSGALLLPAGFSMILLVPLTGRLADRLDPGKQVAFGLALFAFSFVLLSHADLRTAPLTLALWIMVSRIGMAFLFPALSAGSVRALPPKMLAQGAQSMNFTRQLGGAVGINLLAVLLQQQTDTNSLPLVATQSPDNTATATYLSRVAEIAGPAGLSDIENTALAMNHLSSALHGQASAMAFSTAFEASAVAMAIALLGAGLMVKARRNRLRREALAANQA